MGLTIPPMKHTELTDKEVAGVIDHANLSITDVKLASGVGLLDTQICKLPTTVAGKVLIKGAKEWGAGDIPDASITDAMLASGVGLDDGEICKLPTATAGKVLRRGATAWEAGDVPAGAIEGDYSSYAYQWKDACTDWEFMLRCDESLDKIFTRDMVNLALVTRKLSDGADYTPTAFLNAPFWGSYESDHEHSVLRKYFAFVFAENGGAEVPKLKIYKDGTLLQTIDLSQAPISWTNVTPFNYIVSMSVDGKYILVVSRADNECALFEGS